MHAFLIRCAVGILILLAASEVILRIKLLAFMQDLLVSYHICALISLLGGGLYVLTRRVWADYMNQSSSALVAGKTQKILDSVRALQKEYPHYRIYLTGHSLVSIIRSRWLNN